MAQVGNCLGPTPRTADQGRQASLIKLIARLCHEGRFRMLPLPNSTGFDDGLLFYRLHPAYVDVVAAWSDKYAVSLRVPPQRNMRDPFLPSPAVRRHVGEFAEIVGDLVSGVRRHSGLYVPTAAVGASKQGEPTLSGEGETG